MLELLVEGLLLKMRQLELFANEMQYDADCLLNQKYDNALIGVDFNTNKFVYDIEILEQIVKQDHNTDDVSVIMDKEFFTRQNQPIFFQKFQADEAKDYLKIIHLLREAKNIERNIPID